MPTELRDEPNPVDDLDRIEADADADAELPLTARTRTTGWVLLIGGLIGFFASFSLTLEYIHNLTDPSGQLVCDISLFVTCQPAMHSTAGSLFGFPNIIVGLSAFTVAVLSGVLIVARIRLPRWYFIGLQVGLIVAIGMITYFQWFTGYQLRALCLWCMVIWLATIPMFVVVTTGNLAHGRLGARGTRVGASLAHWTWVIVLVWYFAVAGLVLSGMWETIRLSML